MLCLTLLLGMVRSSFAEPGPRIHIGVNSTNLMIWRMVSWNENVADVTRTAELLHGQETQFHADAGYAGVEKRAEIVALARQID